jgi:hypothetical protein
MVKLGFKRGRNEVILTEKLGFKRLIFLLLFRWPTLGLLWTTSNESAHKVDYGLRPVYPNSLNPAAMFGEHRHPL